MVVTFFSISVYAKPNIDHFAVMSPSCNRQDIEKFAGEALLSISKKKDWKNTQGYHVKLDRSKMLKHELIQKMAKAKCFDQPLSKITSQPIKNNTGSSGNNAPDQ